MWKDERAVSATLPSLGRLVLVRDSATLIPAGRKAHACGGARAQLWC